MKTASRERMPRRRGRVAACVVALALSLPCLYGCSYSLFQTAHTEPPKHSSATFGLSYIKNSVVAQQGESIVDLGFQTALRYGVTEHLDLGLGGFYGIGLQLDAKYDVFDRAQAWALAPRIGVGYNAPNDMFKAEAGGIVSYRILDSVEPYLGLSFANFWIGNDTQPDTPPPLGSHYAAHTGTGDGLLQLNVGLQVLTGIRRAIMLEYGHWFVLQDDPGDFHRFVPTNTFGFGMRF